MPLQDNDRFIVSRGGEYHNMTADQIIDYVGYNRLPQPDISDDTSSGYFYWGWDDIEGSWLIRRQTRVSSILESSNSGYASLSQAWGNRETLTYT